MKRTLSLLIALLLLLPVESFGASATDSFTGADEDPLSANWTTMTGMYSPKIISNYATNSQTNQDNGAYYNALTPTDDQYAQVVLTPFISTDAIYPGVLLRAQTGAQSSYMCTAYGGTLGAPGAEIWKEVGGVYTSLQLDSATYWNPSDIIRCEVSGQSPNITIVLKRCTPSCATLLTATGETSFNSGRVGIFLFDTGGAAGSVDDWEGGDLTAPPSAVVRRRPIVFQ